MKTVESIMRQQKIRAIILRIILLIVLIGISFFIGWLIGTMGEDNPEVSNQLSMLPINMT